MRNVLDGIRVIEWTVWLVGPLAGMLLAELGAEVIKIEEPVGGDSARGAHTYLGKPLAIGESKTMPFEAYNCGKKSVSLNVQKEMGQKAVYQLVEKSDVFIQNFRPQIANRYGLSYSELSKYNPKLIYASASGFGPQGPAKDLPSFDSVAQARAGFLQLDETLPPTIRHYALSDDLGGFALFSAVITALLARERTGEGQEVQVSQLGASINAQRFVLNKWLMTGSVFPVHDRATSPNPLFNFYKCRDGKWICLSLSYPDMFWPSFCKAIGMPELENDPRFDTLLKREENCRELISIIEKVFATKDYGEWEEICTQNKLVFSIVNSIKDVSDDPQVLDNEYITSVSHSSLDKLNVVGAPYHLNGTPWKKKSQAPELGQHTEEVLQELCGYSWEEITDLKATGVI